MNIIFAVAVLGGLGAAFGLILSIASRIFAVKEDPRLTPLTEALPGANCGGCGFSGCSAYAEAVIKGEAKPGCCPVGGETVAAKMAEIMGVAAETGVRMVAQVRCTGGGASHTRYDYAGIHDCLTAARVAGGGALECKFGCLGMGTCVKECAFDALRIENGAAKVDREACKACGKCVDICPRKLITLIPYKTRVVIPCASAAKGVVTRKACDNGCIGCSLCVKECPRQAITVENNLAVIDYDKCVGCGLCVDKCPRGLITRTVPLKKKQPAPEKAAAAQ